MKIKKLQRTGLLFYVLVGTCITVGAVLRIWPILNLGLSGDDLFHIRLSGLRLANLSTRLIDATLIDVLRFSYRDVHPPLRNIIFYYALPFVESPTVLRLVSLLPGIGLLFAIALYLRELNFGRFALFAGIFLLTFSREFAHLSQQTRGYMMMFFFSIIAMYFYHRYERTLQRRYLYSGAVLACIALLCEYGAIFLFVPIFLLSLSNSLHLRTERLRRLLAHGLVCLFFALQIGLIFRMKAIPRVQQLSYLDADLGLSFSAQGIKLFRILSQSFIPPNSALGPLLATIAVVGLGLLWQQKRWNLLCLAVTPTLLMTVLNSVSLYPLQVGRTSLLLALSFLIPICFFIEVVGKRKFANLFFVGFFTVLLVQALSYRNVDDLRSAYRSYNLSGLPRFNYTYSLDELRHASTVLTSDVATRNNPKALYIVHSIGYDYPQNIVQFQVLLRNLQFLSIPHQTPTVERTQTSVFAIHETIVRDFSAQFSSLVETISKGIIPVNPDFAFLFKGIAIEDLRDSIWITSRDRLSPSFVPAGSVTAVIDGREILLSYFPEMNLVEISPLKR